MSLVNCIRTQAVLCAIFACGAAAAVTLDKCPVQGGSVRAAMTGSPPTLDFISSFAATARDIGVYVYEGLVTVDANYDVAPQLAESWTISPDKKTYTFHLRKGVKFHDGTSLTADDAVASIERFLAQSPRKADLSMIAGVRFLSQLDSAVDLHKARDTIRPRAKITSRGHLIPSPHRPSHVSPPLAPGSTSTAKKSANAGKVEHFCFGAVGESYIDATRRVSLVNATTAAVLAWARAR